MNNGRVLAILQARMSSTRLPGKVLKPILGEPMLLRQLERLRRSHHLDLLVVATSTSTEDDPIAQVCQARGIDCFRGSLDDVLDRFYQAVRIFPGDTVVRLTADCPLTDPEVIDAVIDFYQAGDYDYVSNVLEPTFPDGLDVEVFGRACLEAAWREAKVSSDREHVTPFIYHHPDRFRVGSYRGTSDLSAWRWTVDEPADFQLVNAVYEALYQTVPDFSTRDILNFLSTHPDIAHLNVHFRRNEGSHV